MAYFISQEQDRGWRVDAEALVARLRGQWPDVRIVTIDDPGRKYSHQWSISTAAGDVEGMIHRKRTSLTFDAPPGAAAEFAVWYQNEVVGADHDLLLYDEQYTRVTPLRPGITPQDVRSALT